MYAKTLLWSVSLAFLVRIAENPTGLASTVIQVSFCVSKYDMQGDDNSARVILSNICWRTVVYSNFVLFVPILRYTERSLSNSCSSSSVLYL